MQRGSLVGTVPARRSSSLMRTSMLGTTARREIIAMQIDLDKGIFDSSLGCPLASYEDATLALVGGKALQVCITIMS